MKTENNYGQDAEFLRKHVETIELTNDEGAAIVLVPAWQGRTMTSTARGPDGTSFGWINYDLIASGKKDPILNLYGGEDRFWISPEGGQFSFFFDPDVPLTFENWRTPDLIDTTPFDIEFTDDHSARFTQTGTLTNYSRFEFHLQMDREVRLLDRSSAASHCTAIGCGDHPVDFGDLAVLAHESHNTLTNLGDLPWRQQTGLIGIWMLCMNKPSPTATLVVPFRAGDPGESGPPVNADYFGKLDSSRLVVDEDESLAYFLGDGEMRSKLGVTFERACPHLGSWDPVRGVLSIVDFCLPESAPRGYTNNLWEIQDQPFAGDVINAYNDGPNESGGKLGGFFELETISPALALDPGRSYTHWHRTIRLEGDRRQLSAVSTAVFGVDLDRIESRFGN